MNLNGKKKDMKKIYIFTALAAMAMLALSCNKEMSAHEEKPEIAEQNLTTMTFTAEMEGTNTKTTLNLSDGSVAWAVGDAIKFDWELDGVASGTTSSALSSGDIEGGTATFTASVPAAFMQTEDEYISGGGTSLHMYATYPSSIVTDYYGDTKKFFLTVPSTQDGTFANASIALAKWDKENPTAPLEFKNLCGLLQIVISDANVRKIVVSSDVVIAGKMGLTFGSGYPTVYSDPANEGVKEITINVTGAGTYYVAVLPSDISNLYVALYDGSSPTPVLIGDKTASNTLNIKRKQIRKLGTITTGLSDRLYFKADGTGAGTSWDDAAGVATLISTMKSASVITKDLYLAAGDYPIENQAVKPASGTTLKIYGGYPSAATGVALSGRDIKTNVTTIKNTAGRTFYTQMGNWLFDGLTFTSTGYANNSAPGCALLLLAGTQSATVNKCTFSGSVHEGSQGGAVRVACEASFKDCTFSGNTSTKGNAGAIWVTNTGTLTADKCMFSENGTSADSKCGGAIFNNGGVVRLTDCSFVDNTALATGGYGGAIASFNGSVFADRCYFRGSKGLVKFGGQHIDMRSGILGVNNCVFTGPFGQGVNQINNAGASPQPIYIVNTVFHSQQSEALIANAGEAKIVSSIILNAASGGDGISVANTSSMNLDYSLYNKAAEAEGQMAPVVNSCVAGITGNTGGTAFPTWYNTNAATMNSDDQTSSTVVADARGSVHYYIWNGSIPADLGTITFPTLTQVKDALGTSDFLTWLGDANLSVDIRGVMRDTNAMWPGSYQGTGKKAGIEGLSIR
jgi:hypothetical protein